MENENFKPEESLRLIESMISTAKNKLADDGFHLIFWGWLVFSAAMIHYITVLMNIPYGYLVWPILMPLGGIISGVYGYKQGKKQKVKTYIDTYLSYLWGAFAIGMVVTLVCMPWHGVEQTYFCLMILYGIATFISGGLLNFKPLVYGSFFSFAGAVIAVFNGENEHLLLIISIALLFSYIIPGHLLRAKYKSENV
jgi:hypothetical protein